MKYSTVQLFTDIFKRITLGKVQKKMSLYDLKKDKYETLLKPVFILSTGRCRTHWLTNVIAGQERVMVQHQPDISFLEEGKLMYELSNTELLSREKLLLKQLVCTARDHIWLACAKRELRYIETNNRFTFAAPVVKDLIPSALFVHLTRHPVEFIRSGRNRNWYEGDAHDLGRIVMQDKNEWDLLNLNQKIGWLWMETNRYIFEQVKDIPSKVFTIPSEKLDREKMKELFTFLELDHQKIEGSWFNKPTNIQEDQIGLETESIKSDLKEAPFYNELLVLASDLGYKLKK